VTRTPRLAATAAASALACVALLSACSTSTTIVPRPASSAEVPSEQPSVPAEPLLDKQETTVLDQPLAYPTQQPAQVTSAIITLLPGQETGPHRHEVPLYAYVLAGTVTVEYDGGVAKTYPEGTAFMEAIGTQHNGRNLGTTTVRILVTFMGAEGANNTVKL